MPVSAEQRAHGVKVLTRGGLLVLTIAGLMFLPSPHGPIQATVFETLLLVIFAMLTIGLTGQALLFVSAVGFVLTAALPIVVLSWAAQDSAGGWGAALTVVIASLTETHPVNGALLMTPTRVVAFIAWVLQTAGFRLRWKG